MDSPRSLPEDNAETSIYSFSVNDVKESIKRTGAYSVANASAGDRVDDFTNKRLHFKTPEGLEFCAKNILYDKNIRTVTESSIDRPHWGLAKYYKSGVLPSDKAYFFVDGSNIQVVVILLWSPGSQILLFEGSHDIKLDGKEMSVFGIRTLPREHMHRDGISEVRVEMTEGGYALIDGRLGWTLLNGCQIAIGFASEVEISEWGKMTIGDTGVLRDKVKELNDNGIRTNFKYVTKPPSTILTTKDG